MTEVRLKEYDMCSFLLHDLKIPKISILHIPIHPYNNITFFKIYRAKFSSIFIIKVSGNKRSWAQMTYSNYKEKEKQKINTQNTK